MLKTAFIVRGPHDVGKTGTIREVYQRVKHLTSRYGVVEEHHFMRSKSEVCVLLTVVEINIKIGIISPGDVPKDVEQRLNLMIEFACNIIVCATRSRGNTVKAAENTLSKYDKVWIEKKRVEVSQQDGENTRTARDIAKQTEALLETYTGPYMLSSTQQHATQHAATSPNRALR